MATTLDELLKKIEANNATRYTPLTAEQIQQQANTRYSGLYGQKRLSAQQQYETSDKALEQQLAGLDDQYKKQLEQSAKNYEGAYRTADRQSLDRGMQRSSYNSATLANINLQGAEAQQAIRDTQAAQAKNIGEQRALLKNQLGDTLANLDAAQQSDILAYIDELEAREYDRLRDDTAMQNEIAMNLYQYQFQKEQADQEQRNWQAQFDAQHGGGDAGGGYGGGGSQNPTGSSIWDLLGGNGSDTGSKLAAGAAIYNGLKTAANNAVGKVTPTGKRDEKGVKKGSKQ